MSDTVKKLIEIAARRFTVEASTLSATDDFFEKLSINSLQALNLLSDLETAFDVEIPDYELADIRTFEGLADAIDRRRTSC